MKNKLSFLGLASFIMGAQLLANPSGPTVVSGDVSFSTSGDLLTITSNSDRTIIDWDDFSISSYEQTDFVLPFFDSAVLNRVTSTNVSNLLGVLTSNANVYLINENGIVIGPNGVIATSGFLGSTLDAIDSQFLDISDMNFFSAQYNSVINYGSIFCSGDVILIGSYVENDGQITAKDFTVALGAGNDILLQPYAPSYGDRIIVFPGGVTNQTGIGVNNTGTIDSFDVELKADGNPYIYAINCEGWINATESGDDDGRVVLLTQSNSQSFGGAIRVNGLITSSGNASAGGNITIIGNDLLLDSNCALDCSGDAGGGQILIGGSLQNSDPTIATALNCTMNDTAYINVTSNYFGDGGICVLWSDDTVTFNGRIDARGGSFFGNGGTVQICGQNSIMFNGIVDVTAPNGSDGLVISCQ